MKRFEFKVGENVHVFECTYRSNRSGFVHECAWYRNGWIKVRNKAQYYNRTWESYEYQSVMSSCVRDMLCGKERAYIDNWKVKSNRVRLSKKEKDALEVEYMTSPECKELNNLLDQIRNYKGWEDDFKPFKMLCALADIITDNIEEQNKLKKQTLSSMPGIQFPDDWDSLSEEEKTNRLNKAKEVL